MTPSSLPIIYIYLAVITMFQLNFLQLNVQGIIGSEHKDSKIQTLNTMFHNHNIHIALLQEWSVQYRHNISPSKSTITLEDGSTKSLRFPIDKFPNYYCHYQDTNLCTLYHKDLNIHPILDPKKDPNNKYNKKKFNRLRCALRLNQTELYIDNIYNPNSNDIQGFFNNPYHTSDTVLCAGDINLHHQSWGDSISETSANTFIDLLNESEWNILSTNQFPTRRDKAHNTVSAIDVIFGLNTTIDNYHVHTHPDLQISDHFIITFSVPLQKNPIYRHITIQSYCLETI